MTDSEPPAPSALALLVANSLVTKGRMRLADARDSRLGSLTAFSWDLATAMWTGSRAAFVGFFLPPPDASEAQADVAARYAAAQEWGLSRIGPQGAERCDILLVALAPLPPMPAPKQVPGVTVGVVAVDVANASATEIISGPSNLPSAGDLRKAARYLADGGAAPTLAAVDLAERQTVAGGYNTPARTVLAKQPIVTYSLIAIFVVIWVIESALIRNNVDATGHLLPPTILDFGAFNPFGDQQWVWWRFFSATFLHETGTIFHVGLNSFFLYIVGRFVEQVYGRLVLLGAFLISGVGACFGVIAATSLGLNNGIVLGASGGLCGLLGLLLVLGRVQGQDVPVGLSSSIRRQALRNSIFIIAYSVLLSGSFPGLGGVGNIAWSAHAGGLVTGAALGLVFPPLASIGGRDLSVAEKVAIYAVIALAACALVVAAANVIHVELAPNSSLG